ncbi:MAG: hypothetical protein JNM31_04610 [Flavobacteriales bacterium]|nr:hypothetical protein [Flavobacteriales bacterium]
MKTLRDLSLVAAMAALAPTAQAQNVGAACGCPPVSSRTTVNISTLVDANNNLLSSNTVLTCNNLYILNTRMYVNAGQDLFIEPGTVIKGNSNPGAAHAIIVARDGQIWANGSESCPIIMTAAADPLDGSYAVTNRGQWGSLIVLGRAYTNKRTTDGDPTATATNGVGTIEGLAAGDSRHLYGNPVGTELNDDNSGVLRYVSLRHGGQVIGANNEINGLTLGGLGRGTTIDHIEVVSNLDDAFEFFGGTVNAKYLVGMHCDDDYIDWDQGYSGKLQFLYNVQGPDNSGGALNQGDNGIEADGDDAATNFANGGLRSTPVVYNATFIGRNNNDEGIEAKERTQGIIVNSVFARFAQGLNMTTEVETFWNSNEFQVRNCTFQGVTNAIRINGAFPAVGSPAHTKFFTTDGNLAVAANALIDATYNMPLPGNAISGNDRLNPVPAAGTAATTLTPPVDGFFSGAKYRGAFQPGAQPWTKGWTLAEQLGLDLSVVSGCLGDLNNDGLINASDFGLFVPRFGLSCY